MNKKPLLLRSLLVLVVVAVFCAAMYPLAEKDYYEVFQEMLIDPDNPDAARVIELAKAKEEADPNLFQSEALLQAAAELGISLRDLVEAPDAHTDRDVISLIRKKAASSIRLGLDLNGGVEFYLDLVPDENPDEEMRRSMEEDFDRYRDVAVETLRKRLESKSIFEAEIAPSGERGIVLRAPIVSRDEKAQLRDLIQMSAKLHFRLVIPATPEQLAAYKSNPATVPYGAELMEYVEEVDGKPVVRTFLVSRTIEMDGRNITMARAQRDQMTGRVQIMLQFNHDGALDFKRVTENNVNQQLAIVLDGKLYCAPSINEPIAGGNAQISGDFTEEEAQAIADALVSGSFPFRIDVQATFDTDPTLGRASVQNGIYVGIISLIVVALFMVIYYRFSGAISVIALALNVTLILGAMAAFDCTLTLPGIAGIVLTIGMAVDANVLIFERIREELKSGKSLLNAVNAGYDRALSAVIDSNITTLIVSFILMYVGTGAIKGFAVTLCIGILSSLFSAVFVTRLVYDYLFRFLDLKKLTMMQMVKESKLDFIKIWRYALMVSGMLILVLVGTLAIRGKGVLGIDFTGGSAITFNYAEKGNTSEMADMLRRAGYDEPSVTYKTNIAAEDGNGEFLEVRLRGSQDDAETTKAKVGELLQKNFPECGIVMEGANIQQLSGLIGKEFTKAALWAIAFALIGIGAYIVFRYELTYAVAAVLALLHDVLVVLAIYLLSGRTIGLTTVAAFLTVIGYSINDTVVIFDRIRENLKLHKGEKFGDLVNLSVNQTISRTLITSLTTFMVVFIMWLFGGPEISDFVFVMMWGIILGTYSSVCLSGPFVAWRLSRSKGAVEKGGK
ncbi:MAG: protein translocase subunit SecD [Lentisphaerae bacterium]|nr:protein translocase subunit SecD [Lentisphaerota bacterium]